jgi:hypothetical protein
MWLWTWYGSSLDGDTKSVLGRGSQQRYKTLRVTESVVEELGGVTQKGGV